MPVDGGEGVDSREGSRRRIVVDMNALTKPGSDPVVEEEKSGKADDVVIIGN